MISMKRSTEKLEVPLEESKRSKIGNVQCAVSTPTHSIAESQQAENASLENVLSSQYWQGLLSAVHCCDEGYWTRTSSLKAHPISADEKGLAELRDRLLTEGFCKIDSDYAASGMVRHTADAIAQLVQHGWHPIWILVFDEPWLHVSRSH